MAAEDNGIPWPGLRLEAQVGIEPTNTGSRSRTHLSIGRVAEKCGKSVRNEKEKIRAPSRL